jgi:hypothetical protein
VKSRAYENSSEKPLCELLTKIQGVTANLPSRVIQYRESLFTFIGQDGIPWENNTAERALRHLTVQEKISGSFHKSLMPAYLRLLEIRQTCRFQGKSFFKFLFSGETDLDTFESRKRKRQQVMSQ